MSAAAARDADAERADHLASMLYSGAVFELATSDDPLRDRIARAYAQHAVLVDHLADALPNGIADGIGRLQVKLGQESAERGVADLAALGRALDRLDDEEVEGVARAICFLAEDLVNWSHPPAPTVKARLRSVGSGGSSTGPRPASHDGRG